MYVFCIVLSQMMNIVKQYVFRAFEQRSQDAPTWNAQFRVKLPKQLFIYIFIS